MARVFHQTASARYSQDCAARLRPGAVSRTRLFDCAAQSLRSAQDDGVVFRPSFVRVLAKYGVAFDERYVWD